MSKLVVLNGSAVKKARKSKRNMPQKRLAEVLDVAERTIREIENRNKPVSEDLASSLSRILGVPHNVLTLQLPASQKMPEVQISADQTGEPVHTSVPTPPVVDGSSEPKEKPADSKKDPKVRLTLVTKGSQLAVSQFSIDRLVWCRNRVEPDTKAARLIEELLAIAARPLELITEDKYDAERVPQLHRIGRVNELLSELDEKGIEVLHGTKWAWGESKDLGSFAVIFFVPIGSGITEIVIDRDLMPTRDHNSDGWSDQEYDEDKWPW